MDHSCIHLALRILVTAMECAHVFGFFHTLIRFAKFSAKIVLIAKLLQNNLNLNDFEYSRHLKARIIEKRPKKI